MCPTMWSFLLAVVIFLFFYLPFLGQEIPTKWTNHTIHWTGAFVHHLFSSYNPPLKGQAPGSVTCSLPAIGLSFGLGFG